MEIADFLIGSYVNEQGVHAETLLGAAAALAGEFALRAAEPILPDEGWVISTNAAGLLFENEASGEMTLWSIIRIGAERSGVGKSDMPDPGEAYGRAAAASFGSTSYPPLTVPAEHYPHEWSPNACPRYREAIAKIGALHGLPMKDLAMALALAITLIMSKTAQILPPAIAARLVLEIMIGVSRMPPLQAEVAGSSGAAGADSKQQQAPAEPGIAKPRPAQGFGTRQDRNGGGTISPNIGKAAGAMASHLMTAYEEGGNADAAKVIGALAALAGEFSLRATDDIGPGAPQWIVSTNVNGLLFEDEAKGIPNLWSAIRGSVQKAGVTADELPDPITVVAQTAAAIGGSPFPPLTIPKEYYPAEWSPNACPRFRHEIERIGYEFRLSEIERALALGYAIGASIVAAANVYPPAIAATLALEVMIGVSRMRPLATEIT
ncbi:MAG: hypothetical protein OEQ29_21820 [Alphaproteobacteria bacterium]|nr:hypothetical protein [Alphaproteobacteria bacterium]